MSDDGSGAQLITISSPAPLTEFFGDFVVDGEEAHLGTDRLSPATSSLSRLPHPHTDGGDARPNE
jgi:hypothetical protein